MHLTWDHQDGWFDREYCLKHDGQYLTTFGEEPTLDELREAERKYGTRINLWQAGLLCTDCSNDINGRFAADTQGNLLCWDCAMDAQGDTLNGVRVNTDPTKAIISESSLHKKSLCDHVINVATGCRHGCKFCYVPTTPAIQNREGMLEEQAAVKDAQREWGGYLLYRDDLPERLHRILEERNPRDRKHTKRGRGVVMLSSGTDCYQDRRAAQITRGCVQELFAHEIPVRILTRSSAVVRDIDLFTQRPDLITVGSSIPSFDTELVKAIEPNAPPPMKRWEALDRLQKQGVPVFVSMSPTYPTMDSHELSNLIGHFTALAPEVVFHEPINPRGGNFQMCLEAAQELGHEEVTAAFEALQDERTWVEYALEQINRVQQEAQRYGIPVHSWPDRELVKATTGSLKKQLRAMQQAVSPEHFSAEPQQAEAQAPLAPDTESLFEMIDLG